MSIQLSTINVVGLFGHLTYKIEDLDHSDIIYLIGKNGTGKTTILRLISALGSQNWTVFNQTEYNSLSFTFAIDDGEKTVHFQKQENKDICWALSQQSNVKDVNDSEWDTSLPYLDGYFSMENDEERAEWLEKNTEQVERASCGRHWTIDDKGHYEAYRVIELMDEYIQVNLIQQHEVQFLTDFQVAFISVDRLKTYACLNSSHERTIFDRLTSHKTSESAYKYTVEEISDELSDLLKEHVLTTEDSSRESEPDFLEQLLTKPNSKLPSIKELREDLDDLNDLEEKAENYGLYPKRRTPLKLPQGELEENQKRILSVFLDQRESNLAPHKDFLKQLELFTELVNSSYSYKEIKSRRSEGIVAFRNGTNIKLDQLSSGEQHILVLAYKLLFAIPKNSCVLIDEPELSMHIQWQRNFSSMLEKIGKLRQLRFLCATHSPLIIDDNRDYMRGIK